MSPLQVTLDPVTGERHGQELCRIIIPKPYPGMCVAECALSTEGLSYEVVELNPQGPWCYAALLARLWRERVYFTIVEHDVAPWPGAIVALSQCGHPYCTYRYAHPPGAMRIQALGCTKFAGPAFDAEITWERAEW